MQCPGGSAVDRAAVRYDAFIAYEDHGVPDIIAAILDRSLRAADGVVVTASVIAQDNYPPVIAALNELARRRGAGDAVGPIWFVACENTLSAPPLFADLDIRAALCPEAVEHVTAVHALVDRMCVGLEEAETGDGPAVLVLAEDFGSVKLQLDAGSEELAALCDGSAVLATVTFAATGPVAAAA